MQLEEIRRRLKNRNVKACARDTGVAYMTIIMIANGATKKPKPETLKKITKWIKEN